MEHKTFSRTLYGIISMALVLGLAAAALPQKARAMDLRPNTGTVAAGEVIDDDLLIASDTVDMAGTVNGNLIIVGGDITVSGTVNGDVIAAGGTIHITGTVDGNILCAGNTLELDGPVTGSLFCMGYSIVLGTHSAITDNMYVGGFSLETKSGSTIGRDAAMGGYQLLLGGEIKRDVHANVGALKITGTIGRDVIADVEKPDPQSAPPSVRPFTTASSRYSTPVLLLPAGLQVAESAKIGGKISYTSPADQSAAIKSQPAGGIQYTYRPEADSKDSPSWDVNPAMMVLQHLLSVMREFLGLIIIGALAVWLLPTWLTRSKEMLQSKPLASFGWGLLWLFALPVGMLVAAVLIFLLGLTLGIVTLGGLMGSVWMIGFNCLGLAFGIYSAMVWFGSKLVVALLAGAWFMSLVKKDYTGSIFWPLLIGLVMYTILYAIPFVIGWIISGVVIIFGIGAVYLAIRDWYQNRKTASVG
jgi:cytoskeletal protein CcmA (bactofilin family)